MALGCVGLSRIQRSRVRTIGRLAQARSGLLAELTGLEERERRALSEHLHDGALQYVLAARFDLDDARETGDPAAFDRLEQALAESTRLLRSTVAELHPAVLARAGLPSALRDLAAAAAARGGLTVDVDADGWPAGERTAADPLLYRTAGELLNNVVKHAQATSATVTLALADDTARLVVADDGVGMPENAAGGALRRGHIGLASHTLRIDAAGGRFTSAPGEPRGTVVTVELPVRRSEDTASRPPHRPAGRRYRRAGRGIVEASGKHPKSQPREAPAMSELASESMDTALREAWTERQRGTAMSTTAFEIDNTVRPTVQIARSAEGKPVLDATRLWTGGVATAVVAALISVVGVLVLQVIATHVPHLPVAAGLGTAQATVLLATLAAIAALAATGLAHLLLVSTPRPMAYLGWIVGLATAAAVVLPLTTGAVLAAAVAEGILNLVIGLAIGSLVTGAAYAANRAR